MKSPAINFPPMCPDCGHEMFEINGRFECLYGECENLELKAPDNCSDEMEQESVVDSTVTVPQDKQSTASVKQKGANAKRM